jgi:lysophospholipase L1-like esterase
MHACLVAIALLAADPAPATIIAFGDSTTAPRGELVVYAQVLQKELPIPARVINAGVGGNTTEQARARFEKDVLARKPALVVIQLGINDASVDVWKKPPATGPRVELDRYEANLRHFVQTLKGRGARVIVMTPNALRWTDTMKARYGKPPYRPDDPDGLNVLLKRYADAAREVARAEGVPLVDVYAAFEAHGKEKGHTVDELLLDGIHPNEKGHRLVADLLLARIPELLKR